MSVDIGPVNVSGVFRASRARVIYDGAKLHVFQTATRHVAFETGEPELGQDGLTYRAALSDGSGELQFSRRGCSTCGYSLGRIPAEQLLALAVT